MTKFYILIALAISLASSQTPIPVPRLNATNLNGLWWVQWQYFSDPHYNPTSYDCYSYNITVTPTAVDVHWENIYSDQEWSGDVHYKQGSSPAQWLINPIDGYNKTIVAYDYLQNSWFLIGDNDYQWAMLFSRSQNMGSQIQINVAINLLIAEGYTVTSNTTASYNNTHCSPYLF